MLSIHWCVRAGVVDNRCAQSCVSFDRWRAHSRRSACYGTLVSITGAAWQRDINNRIPRGRNAGWHIHATRSRCVCDLARLVGQDGVNRR